MIRSEIVRILYMECGSLTPLSTAKAQVSRFTSGSASPAAPGWSLVLPGFHHSKRNPARTERAPDWSRSESMAVLLIRATVAVLEIFSAGLLKLG